MTRHIASLVPSFLGVILLILEIGSNAQTLNNSDLAFVTGGVEHCFEEDNTNTVDSGCTECLSNGNGGSIECTTTQFSNQIVPYSGPHMQCTNQMPQCGGLAFAYFAPNTTCAGTENARLNCGRTYNFWNCSTSPGPDCQPL